MSEFPIYTPDEVIAEARRVAASQCKDKVLEIGSAGISEMIGHLPGKQYKLFLRTFCEELIRLNSAGKDAYEGQEIGHQEDAMPSM